MARWEKGGEGDHRFPVVRVFGSWANSSDLLLVYEWIGYARDPGSESPGQKLIEADASSTPRRE